MMGQIIHMFSHSFYIEVIAIVEYCPLKQCCSVWDVQNQKKYIFFDPAFDISMTNNHAKTIVFCNRGSNFIFFVYGKESIKTTPISCGHVRKQGGGSTSAPFRN